MATSPTSASFDPFHPHHLAISPASGGRFFAPAPSSPKMPPSISRPSRPSFRPRLPSNTSRKRARNESVSLAAYDAKVATTTAITPIHDLTESWSSAVLTPDAISPAPLANSVYQLSGGLDTPTAAQAAAFDVQYEDRNSRRGGGQRRIHSSGYFEQADENSRGQAREESQSDQTAGVFQTEDPRSGAVEGNGWGSFVFSAVSVVAGKMWDLCTTGFRGFYAGGGQSYAMSPNGSFVQAQPGTSYTFDAQHDFDWQQGAWNEETPCKTPNKPAYSVSSSALNRNLGYSPQRATKKARTSTNASSAMRDDWVLIDPGQSTSRPSTPTQRQQGIASAAALRSPSVLNHVVSDSHTSIPVATFGGSPRRRPTAVAASVMSSPARVASSAGLRSPHGGHRVSRSHSYYTAPSQQLQPTTSAISSPPRKGHERRASHLPSVRTSSTRQHELGITGLDGSRERRGSTATNIDTLSSRAAAAAAPHGTAESPIAKEAAQYAKRARKREREEARGLTKLNRRLEDMIREGREALGSRVEVYESEDDSGEELLDY